MDILKEVLHRLQQAPIPDDGSGRNETVVYGVLAGLAARLLQHKETPSQDLWRELDKATEARDAELTDEESKARLRLWSTVLRALVWRNTGNREAYLEDLHWAVVDATSTNASEMLGGIYDEVA